MMNRLKALVSIIVLFLFLSTIAFSEDASKHLDRQKIIKNPAMPKGPLLNNQKLEVLGTQPVSLDIPASRRHQKSQ